VGISLANVGMEEGVAWESISGYWFYGVYPLLRLLKNVDSLSSINIIWLCLKSSNSALWSASLLLFDLISISSSF
jgi:hypothetical protein